MYRISQGFLIEWVLAVAVWGSLVCISSAGAVEPPNEFYITIRVKGEFNQVVADLKKAIRVNNYFVGEITNVDSGLKKRGALKSVGITQYKIIGFCNLSLAGKALRINPNIGVFMPCRLAVYQKTGSKEVVIAAMRPTYMARVFKDSGVKKMAEEVEKVLLRILDAVQF
jgi:cytochrome c oxidase cbb3-type subunit 3